MSSDEEEKAETPMGRPKSAPKTRNVKITEAAHEAARIASGYTGESFVEYVSRIVAREANSDIVRFQEEWKARPKTEEGGEEQPKGKKK